MMDVVRKNGDKINTEQLSKELGCKVCEISALKGTGITEAANLAIKVAKSNELTVPQHSFSGAAEHAIAHIEEAFLHDVPEEQQRWYAIKIFERDEKVLEQLNMSDSIRAHIEKDIEAAETEMDDDSESIITNERYIYIGTIIKDCLKKKNKGGLTTSDKIDRVVTNRVLGLPIFAVIMFLIYYISMVTVGSAATDWANDGLFGDGWHLFGIGCSKYDEAAEEYGDSSAIIDGLLAQADADGIDISAAETAIDTESDDFDAAAAETALTAIAANYSNDFTFTYELEDEETLEVTEETASVSDFTEAVGLFAKYDGEPDPANYGVWVVGIPSIIESGLDAINCADWLEGLILDGIVAGVGAVLGFVPQMLVLFLLLAIVEACGYMARVAFVLDRVFRKFGLSGKSFIPILVGTGCGVPGVMASRTIENERDRRMTIMTTTFIPCGAKTPFIAMIAGAIFGGSAWVATGAYFIGIAAIICSGIMLKKTKMFAGDPAPFVMELPAYHMPTVGNVLRSMWERGWSFIKKAGTIITLSTIFVWATSFFGVVDGSVRMLDESEMSMSFLAKIGSAISWIFAPLGWGNWQATVAAITGLVAKENIVGTLGILYGGGDQTVYQTMGAAFTQVSGMSFLIFNLLCAPCFAAMGAIKREMNNTKWFWFAIGYECGFAYIIALIVNQFGNLFTGNMNSALNVICLIAAIAALVFMIYMLVKPYKESDKLNTSSVKSAVKA
jgi:ferrous iron transport protein B